ncbi:hypothetical protein THAOC_24099, partial [Thalassiosira oceanica]
MTAGSDEPSQNFDVLVVSFQPKLPDEAKEDGNAGDDAPPSEKEDAPPGVDNRPPPSAPAEPPQMEEKQQEKQQQAVPARGRGLK